LAGTTYWFAPWHCFHCNSAEAAFLPSVWAATDGCGSVGQDAADEIYYKNKVYVKEQNGRQN
jgi:hypothetical protein